MEQTAPARNREASSRAAERYTHGMNLILKVAACSACVGLALSAGACGSAALDASFNGPRSVDSGASASDSAMNGGGDDATPNPALDDGGSFPTKLVLVHTGVSDLPLGALRACWEGGPVNAAPSDYAHPMPLANFPGVPIGGAVDLGVIDPNVTSLTLYSAKEVATQKSEACSSLAKLPSSSQLVVPISLEAGHLNFVGIGPLGSGSRTIYQAAVAPTYVQNQAPLTFHVGHMASGVATGIDVTYQTNRVNGGAAGHAELGTIDAQGTTLTALTVPPTNADWSGHGIGISSPVASFTFAEIQGSTDPTTTPAALYGSRTEFVLLLTGSQVTTTPAGGTELHEIVVPVAY